MFEARANTFVEKLAAVRQELSLTLKYLIQFCHVDPFGSTGGTEKLITEEKYFAIDNGLEVVQIFPQARPQRFSEAPCRSRKFGLRVGKKLILDCSIEIVTQLLVFTKDFAVCETAVVHHLLNWSFAEFDLIHSIFLKPSKIPLVFCAHDFFALCPSINFYTDRTGYCGAPSLNSTICNKCEYGLSRDTHFNEMASIMHQSSLIVAPSEPVRALFAAQLPHLAHKIQLIPHKILESKPAGLVPQIMKKKLRIGFIGYELKIKGWDIWHRLNANRKIENRYEFVQVGGTGIDLPRSAQFIPYRFSEKNLNAAVAALQASQLDVLLILSVVPETFSFVLHESLEAGIPVIAFAVSGNVAYMIDRAPQEIGRVFDKELDLFTFFENGLFNEELAGAWKNNLGTVSTRYNPPIFLSRVLK